MKRSSILSIFILLIVTGVLLEPFPSFEASPIKGLKEILEASSEISPSNSLATIEENTILPISSSLNPGPQVIKKMNVIVTAYSSSPEETDEDPYITAAGTRVREGILANNILPFGTKVKIPEIYGDKIFVVEDRMNWRQSNYHIDIWFPSSREAKNFGARRTYIEILKG